MRHLLFQQHLRPLFAISLAIAASIPTSPAAVPTPDEGTLGPWRVGDMAYSKTLADDRPNDLSRQLKAKYYSPLIPEKVVAGEKGELSFRIAPRAEGWAGILIMDKSGTPLPVSKRLQVTFTDGEGKPAPG